MNGSTKVKGFRMVESEEMGERAVLLQALKGYLEELSDTGVDELYFEELPPPSDNCSASGNPQARLLFVMTGAGFAGEAGGLLANIIKAMGFAAEEVHLLSFSLDAAGTPKVTREELLGRITAVDPEVVVTLGEPAAQLLLASREPIGALRGAFHDLAGTPLMPSLHPEALVEDPALKREVWGEMQQVMKRLAGNR
jgi:uracil-DNA glycosylase